ncbi:Lrp/AsnC family transcriptional regulator [Chloroflexota bacterium]
MDHVDRKILALLGRDGTLNSAVIAEKIGVSYITVRRRIQRLKSKHLVQFAATIDPKAIGYPVTVFMAIDVQIQKMQSVLSKLEKMECITWLTSSTGRFDILAIAVFQSSNDLTDFIEEELAALEGLSDIETFVCLEIRKGRYIPAWFAES